MAFTMNLKVCGKSVVIYGQLGLTFDTICKSAYAFIDEPFDDSVSVKAVTAQGLFGCGDSVITFDAGVYVCMNPDGTSAPVILFGRHLDKTPAIKFTTVKKTVQTAECGTQTDSPALPTLFNPSQSSTSLFGPATPPQPSTSLFGPGAKQAAPPQPSTSLFGPGAKPAAPPQPSTSLFGPGAKQAAPPQPSTSLFGPGAKPVSTLFGPGPKPAETQQPSTSAAQASLSGSLRQVNFAPAEANNGYVCPFAAHRQALRTASPQGGLNQDLALQEPLPAGIIKYSIK
ncbi:hypothetical protein [Largemouth bass virus]|uniref:Uncharacterized protein n=1 Tax=Largemouth bass virus TaxID=176656 RepID=A0A9E7PRP7_9VIRU|nr:hypothetical protein [Largemouth bass virus]